MTKKLTALQIAQRRAAEAEARLRSAQLSLFAWNDNQRGIANALARSALFAARNNADKSCPRTYLKEAAIVSTKDYAITYTGEELRTDEELVLINLIHLARDNSLQQSVDFAPYKFMRDYLDWSASKHNYLRLKDSILRLSASNLTIGVVRDQQRSVRLKGQSLVRSFEYEDTLTGEPLSRWVVTLEPDIVNLFEVNETTYIEWKTRQRLVKLRSPIAIWLHSYYASHREPAPVFVATLRSLCGSNMKTLFHFKEKLCKALDKLKEVDFLLDWKIEDDKVFVLRNHTHHLPSLK